MSFRSTNSSETGLVYEVLPGPAALDPSQSPTPFSNNTATTSGSYSYCFDDKSPEDSEDSEDAVATVNIRFTGNDGREFKIDKIEAIHKAEGTGGHTFYGGTATNKVIHGNTGVGTNLEPKLLAYITLWGKTDLKDANTGEIIAPGRMVYIMTTTNVRDENLELITSREVDSSDHNIRRAQTHIILPPLDMEGNIDPIPGTDHGFLHMMFGQVELTDANRDPTLVYEVLPGPAAIDPTVNPSSFSNNIAYAAGSYSYNAQDITENDSEDSEDEVNDFMVEFERLDGTTFIIDNVNVIHKAEGTGGHTFLVVSETTR